MLKAIHAFYFASTTTSGQFVGLYSLADGYGAPGTIPEQGYDWSGVRDSSPAAVARMFAYVETQEV